ncbi:hypothetical protein ACWGLF_19190 [Streptomyces puniciscabiei]
MTIENVSPAVLEDRLRSRPPGGRCLVVGDRQGLLAPSLKVRRQAVAAAYAREIEALYGG